MQEQVKAYEEWNSYSPYSMNVIIIGNKADMKVREVTYEDADIWAEN